MTRERAAHFVQKRYEQFAREGRPIPEERRTAFIDNFFAHGTPPDMAVCGYGWEPGK